MDFNKNFSPNSFGNVLDFCLCCYKTGELDDKNIEFRPQYSHKNFGILTCGLRDFSFFDCSNHTLDNASDN